jgi:hypothetical protein
MKTLLIFALLAGSAQAMDLAICNGQFALCAASSTTPTGKTIVVNGKKFAEGVAVCPILTGKGIADLSLMNGSCKAAPGKVWSLFSTVTSYPQAPTWAVTAMTVTKFVTTKESGMSNMWSFSCEIQAKPVNGVKLASCYGPINESPWNNGHVPVGSTSFTAAPVGAANPVGGNVPGK